MASLSEGDIARLRALQRELEGEERQKRQAAETAEVTAMNRTMFDACISFLEYPNGHTSVDRSRGLYVTQWIPFKLQRVDNAGRDIPAKQEVGELVVRLHQRDAGVLRSINLSFFVAALGGRLPEELVLHEDGEPRSDGNRSS